MMIRVLFHLLLGSLLTCSSYAWNALGHRLVAQIASDHLTPQAKKMCEEYNHYLDPLAPSASFLEAAVWLDQIRRNGLPWFNNLHYIAIPYSKDHSTLPPLPQGNALWGIKHAILVLSSDQSTPLGKGLSLRILMHLVGDVHQPLHTITKISKKFPKGDKGGNLYPLASHSLGDNLHQYWDNGAGILIGQSKTFQLTNKALQLEQKWSCTVANAKKKPQQWIDESHELAITQAYTIASHKSPSKKYQLNTQNITQKQIFSAGCRLAMLLNTIAKNNRIKGNSAT